MKLGLLLAASFEGPRRVLVPVSMAGWVMLTGTEQAALVSGFCGTVTGGWPDWSWEWRKIEAAFALSSPSGLLMSWLLMLLATMSPLLGAPLHHLWCCSLKRHRAGALASFVTAYAVVWIAAGALLLTLAIVLQSVALSLDVPTLLVGCVLTLAWQATPAKQACLNLCHGLPALAAFGLRAVRDSFAFGLRTGLWCVGSCWALMLIPVMADTGQHLSVMAAASAVILVERVSPARSAEWGSAFPELARARQWRRVMANLANTRGAAVHHVPVARSERLRNY